MDRPQNRFWLWLTVITAVGAAWRSLYLVVVKLDDPLLLNDSLYFSAQAGRNSEGDWFLEGLSQLPGAEHGPLTSLYLTPWSLGAGDNIGWQRFAMTLLGIATVAVIGLVGRRLAGPVAGLAAAAIAAAYPNLWINDSLVMSESLAVLLVSVALLLALRFDARPSVGGAVAIGAVVGLGALTRSELALLAVGFAVVAAWRAAGHARRWWMPVALLGATAVVIAPWSIYNTARFERPVLLSTNDGTTLLGANCDQTWYVDVGGWDLRCLDLRQPVEGEVDASVRSGERRERAVEYVLERPGRIPVVVAARVGRVLDLYGLESLVALDVGEEKARPAVWAGIVAFWALAVAAVVGWWRVRRVPSRWWFLVPVAAVLITAALFYGAHRIRSPAEPAIVVLAGTAAATLLGGRLDRWIGSTSG